MMMTTLRFASVLVAQQRGIALLHRHQRTCTRTAAWLCSAVPAMRSHEGVLAVQRRLGVHDHADDVGRIQRAGGLEPEAAQLGQHAQRVAHVAGQMRLRLSPLRALTLYSLVTTL